MSETSTPSGHSPEPRPRLGDERGAIMVLGIFMCATMVSVLWYFAGIGDAIVYRERLQEAADATAYSTAVLHARGMNLIVMINLIMAMVLAIRVALKVLQIVLGIVTVAVDACALLVFSPITAAACGIAAEILHPADEAIEEAIENTREPINDILEALHDVEELVHDVVPAAAFAGGLEVGAKYDPVFAAPTPNPNALTLPTEKGTTNRLCVEAARAVGEMVKELVSLLVGDGLGTIAGWITGPLASMAKASPGYFCELGGGGGPPDVSDLLNKSAGDKCDSDLQLKQHTFDDANQKWHQKCDAIGVSCIDPIFDEFGNKGSSQMEDLTPPLRKDVSASDKSDLAQLQGARDRAEQDLDSFNKGQCVNNTKRQLQQKLQQIPPPQNQSGSGKEPMKVSTKWQNGDPLGQILGASKGDGSMLNRGPKGVKVGAWNDRRTRNRITPPADANIAYAQAEFFYDCAGKWKDNQCNGGDVDGTPHDNEEAMWHFWWRARLRRYNAPMGVIDGVLQATMFVHAGDLAAKAISGQFPRGLAAKGLNLGLRGELAGGPKSLELH